MEERKRKRKRKREEGRESEREGKRGSKRERGGERGTEQEEREKEQGTSLYTLTPDRPPLAASTGITTNLNTKKSNHLKTKH